MLEIRTPSAEISCIPDRVARKSTAEEGRRGLKSRYHLGVIGDLDQQVRVAAFQFLDALQRGPGGDLLSRAALLRGFQLDGHRIGLVSPQQGIFKPAILKDVPLSIRRQHHGHSP